MKDWFLFGEWFGIHWFHSCYLEGYARTIGQRLGYGLSRVVAEQEGNVQRIYFSRSEWSSIGKKYLAEIVNRPELLKKLLLDIHHTARQLITYSKTLHGTKWVQLSVPRQIKILEHYHRYHHNLWTLGQVPNVLELENSFLTDYLKSWLKQQSDLPPTGQLQAFQALTASRELSAVQKEERAMLHLARQKNPSPALRRHWRKYNWLQFGWTGPCLKLNYFTALHRKLYREGKAKEKLRELLERDRQVRVGKQHWIKVLKIPSKIQQLFRLLEEILFLKAYRMDALYESYAVTQPLLKGIATANRLSLQQVYDLYPDWLIDMVRERKFNRRWVEQLDTYSVRYFDGRNWILLLGGEAKELTDPIHAALPLPEDLNELKGACAFPGKVRGKVFIVNHAAEMKKFKENGILVSNVTDPSILPAMRMAKAFVTNMGGLTCHAAIVARELQVPCVVGTKVATQVLKDGDEVEVDATNAIVRKM